MWDFDSLHAAEDEAAGEAPLVYSFLGGEASVRIRAQLHPEENRPEDTSNIVWPAALCLARHLEKECETCQQGAVGSRPVGTGDSPEGRDVLELGAGTGLVGLAALALGARAVVLTDVERVLPTLQYNAELNDNAGHGTLNVSELDFRLVATEGLPAFPRTAAQREITSFDLIVCSDCVLWPELTGPLLATLDQLLNAENSALLTVVHRNAQADVFTGLLTQRFLVESLPLPPMTEKERGDLGGPIRLSRVRRMPNTVSCPIHKEGRLDCSLASRGGSSEVKTEQVSRMTVEQAHSMVDELIGEYSKEAFQSRLFKAYDPVKGDKHKGEAARREVCLEVQAPIMQKYGFAASMEGVINCLSQFYFPPLMYDLLLNEKIQYMMLQTKPWFQETLRLSARMRVALDTGNTLQLLVDLRQTVRAAKEQIESQTGIDWLEQRLVVAGKHRLEDCWKMDNFVPRDKSEDVEVALQRRPAEFVLWLRRLLEASGQESQQRHLEEVPREFLEDQEFVATACQFCPTALKYADESLRSDRSCVYAAVAHSGLALQHASAELREDWDLASCAVGGLSGSGMALKHMGERLKADRWMVIQSITKDAWAIQFASDELRHDKGVALVAVRKNGLVFPELPPRLQGDQELAYAAVEQNGRVLQNLKPWMRSVREVVLAAVRQCPLALEFAGPKMRADREIALVAVRGDGDALRFVDAALQADREVALAAVTSSGCMISHVPESLHDTELALAAARQNVMALEFMEKTLQTKVKQLLSKEGVMC